MAQPTTRTGRSESSGARGPSAALQDRAQAMERAAVPLPLHVPTALGPHLRELVDDVVGAVVDVVPEYAFAGSRVDLVIDAAIRYAIGLAAVGGGTSVPTWQPDAAGLGLVTTDDFRRLFRGLGRQEYLFDRPLERLHSAHCAAGRAAWRFLMQHVASREGLSHHQLHHGADAIFATVEVASSLAAQGYSAARDTARGDRERARERLLALLLSSPGPSRDAMLTLAAAASWTPPERVVCVALEPVPDAAPLPLGPEVLRTVDGNEPCLVLPATPGHENEMASVLRERRAVVGPAVPTCRAAESLRLARRAAALRAGGSLPDRPLLNCRDHLADMVVLDDPVVLDLLVDEVLPELASVGDRQRRRLAETLLAWLDHRGSTQDIAVDLGVHPQTVRYRMGQIRELFGDRLDGPRDRFAMHVALTGRRLSGRIG